MYLILIFNNRNVRCDWLPLAHNLSDGFTLCKMVISATKVKIDVKNEILSIECESIFSKSDKTSFSLQSVNGIWCMEFNCFNHFNLSFYHFIYRLIFAFLEFTIFMRFLFRFFIRICEHRKFSRYIKWLQCYFIFNNSLFLSDNIFFSFFLSDFFHI